MTTASRATRWLETKKAKGVRWLVGDIADYPVLYGGMLHWQGMTFLQTSKQTADLIYGEKLPPIDLPANDQRYKMQTLHALAEKGIRNDQHTRPKSAKHGRR